MSNRVAGMIAIAVALTACETTMTSRPPENPQAVVNQRVAIMKGFGGAIGIATNAAQGKATSSAAQAKVAIARSDVERVESLFPRGTALGDKGVTQSRALSIIFANRSDFEGKFEKLASALAALDTALAHNKLAHNKKAEIGKAVANARAACAECHNKYRAPED